MIADELTQAGVGHRFAIMTTGPTVLVTGLASFEASWVDGAWRLTGDARGDYPTVGEVLDAIRPVVASSLPRVRFELAR